MLKGENADNTVYTGSADEPWLTWAEEGPSAIEIRSLMEAEMKE